LIEELIEDVRVLLAKRHFKAALRRLAPMEPDTPDRDLLMGIALLGRREVAEATRHLRAALARAPADPTVLFHMGHALMAGNDMLGAVRRFERVLALAPDFPDIQAVLAQAYRRDARYEDAIRMAEAVLARGMSVDALYEKAISLSFLGDPAGALASYDALLRFEPTHAAGWFGSHAPALNEIGMEAALERLRRAVGCAGANGRYWAFLCAYLLLLGREAEAKAVFDDKVANNPKRLPLVEGVQAIRPHLSPDARLFGVSAELLRWTLDRATVSGLVLEFGVRRGTSINHIAERAGQTVHGFDSFEGLPEAWVNGPHGLLSTGRQLPPVRDNVVLHPGWFEDTLPPFLRAHDGPVRFVNIDSDIYSSARTVLTALAPRIRVGTVLVFDEYIGNRSWREDEHKAFQEFVRDWRIAYECIAVSPFTKQVAVRITALGEGASDPVAAERTG
jgi:tetratricopeptide (TPR) repeat protein